MRIELASEPGTPGRPNEDLALATPRTLVVLDGVTPHPGGTGCVHGVPWFTARLGGALLAAAEADRARPLADCLAEAIRGTAARHGDGCDLSHPHTPQSTVVAVRLPEEPGPGGADGPDGAAADGGDLEYLVLSDSVLLLEGPDGVRPVLDDRLRRLPEPVPSLRAAVRSAPEGSPERAAARAAYVRGVEALRNAPGGFVTAAADPAAAGAAVTGSVPASRVRTAALLTDGATRLVDVFRVTDWADTVRVLRAEGPDGLLAAVRKAELADPDGTRAARGKPHDDATALLVRWGG